VRIEQPSQFPILRFLRWIILDQAEDLIRNWIEIIPVNFSQICAKIRITPTSFKYANETFSTEYDQKVIIKSLHNEGADAHNMIHRFQAQFRQGAYQLGTVRFWIGEVCRRYPDRADGNCMRRSLLDDLDVKILAALDRSPFESARSRAETLYVALATVFTAFT
jgi:hypothetical protein